MVKDAKVIQRGVNVQDNDLAVPPGTPQHSINVDYSRSGVASKRAGFESFYFGLPSALLDSSYNTSDLMLPSSFTNIFELFSRNRSVLFSNGMMFSYDEQLGYWLSVPYNCSHKITFWGNNSIDPTSFGGPTFTGIGNAIQSENAMTSSGINGFANISPFTFQQQFIPSVTSFSVFSSPSTISFTGAICNDSSQAKIAGSGTIARFVRPFDVLASSSQSIVSDDTSIRNAVTGAVIAGSITSPGSVDNTGSLARFSGASWMDTDNINTAWIADNSNQIRKLVINTGVVTTLAGSVTAGDVDGTGSSARFRNISGIAFDGSNFLYVTEGAGAHRVRKVNVTTGAVSIFAGQLTPTSGYVDGNGTSARFSTPIGIEKVGNTYYIGDSGNSRIRTMDASANVGTFNKLIINSGDVNDGIIGGPVSTSIIPGAVIRGRYTPACSTSGLSTSGVLGVYLSVESTPLVSQGCIDLALVDVTPAIQKSQQNVYHFARCPNTYPNQTSGPNKLDTVGPNGYSYSDVRAVDCGNGAVFTSCGSPRTIDSWNKTNPSSTMPRVRDVGIFPPEAPVATTAAGSNFPANSAWAYRTLCGLNLSDGRISLGPPSERVIVTSGGSTVSGSITAFPSPGLTYDGMAFIQVYRTKTVSSGIDPGDQMFLCYEAPLTYGNGVVVSDLSTDALLGSELYTNQTQLGISGSSLPPPPFPTDVCSFQQSSIFSNTIQRSSVRIKLLGTSGLVSGTSTITFIQGPSFSHYLGSSLTITATSGSNSPPNNLFQIATGGSAAQNAAQTARNIVSCINRSPDAYFFTALYDENDPGVFVVTSMYPGATKNFYIDTTNIPNSGIQGSISFSTNATSSFFQTSNIKSVRNRNSISFSDQGSFDSFPASNSIQVGTNIESILRVLPLADRFLCVKETSVWSVDQSYSSQIYDSSLSTSFPNSFSKINNQWIGLFTRGFCSLNSTQAVAVGRSIDRKVVSSLSNSSALITPFDSKAQRAIVASSASIEVYGNYLCVVANNCYCYNIFSQSWSEWQINSLVFQSDQELNDAYGLGIFSGIIATGSFRDCFIVKANVALDARGVLRQRDFRRSISQGSGTFVRDRWITNYSDPTYSFSGTLLSDLQTISISSYDNSQNTGFLPPKIWSVPAGSGASINNSGFPWVIQITSGSVTATSPGFLSVDIPGLPTSPVTITTSSVISGISSGSVTVKAFSPIITRIQYAPSIAPGSNVNFGDLVLTVERSQPGPLVARFFNRLDYGSASITAVGAFTDNYGVARMAMMPSITTADGGISSLISYSDVQRIPTPSERSFDQQLIVEIWEGAAWQPLAIKSCVVEERVLNNGKIKQ